MLDYIPMKNRATSVILRVAVSGLLIIILLYIMRDKYGLIGQALKKTNPALFAAGLVAYAAAIIVSAIRFKLIIASQDKMPVTFGETTQLTFIGYFFNNFLPTAIGGDIVKAYYLSRKSSERIASFTTVFVDRFIGLVTMIFMAFGALLFMHGNAVDSGVRGKIYIITAMAAAGLVLVSSKSLAKKLSFLLVLVRPIEERLKGLYNAINHYRNHGKLMAQSFAISVASQMLFFIAIGFLAASINSRMSLQDILMRIPIISMMSLLPSLNGFGPREFATKLLFGPLIGDVNAVAVSILWDAVLLLISLAGGVIYALGPRFRIDLYSAIMMKERKD